MTPQQTVFWSDLAPQQRAVREARIRAWKLFGQPSLTDGEPIDRMAQLRNEDQRALLSNERAMEP